MCAVLATKYAVLMLDTNHVDVRLVKEVRCLYVGLHIRFANLVSDNLRILLDVPVLADGNDH